MTLPPLSLASRRIVLVATLVALLPFLMRLRLEASLQRNSTMRLEDVQYIPAPSSLPLLSIGYRKALADLLWVATLVYFGDQIVHKGRMKYLGARTDAILALDPKFRDVYEWIGVVSVYNTGAITLSDIETSNRYLERGIRVFPRDGKLLYLLAFNYAIEMPPLVDDAAQKLRWRQKAAGLFERAAHLPGAPSDAPAMAAEMTKRSFDRTVLIARLRSLLAATTDDRVRDNLLMRLAEVTSEAEADAADRDRREFQAAWRRDYTYLPGGLFVFVGPKLARDGGPAQLETAGDGPAQGQTADEP